MAKTNTINYKKSDLYDRVVDEFEVFEYGYEFMVFLAVVGYREGADPETEDYRGEGEIGYQNIRNKDLYRVIMASLAFQHTSNPDMLVDIEEQMKLLVQYSAAGLKVAEREFGQTAGDPTDAILNYIQEYETEDDTYQGTLGEIVDAFDEQTMGLEQD